MERTNSFVGNPAVDPNIHRIVALGCAGGQSELFCKIDIVQFEPNIRAARAHEIREFPNYLCVENCFVMRASSLLRQPRRLCYVKDRQRNAPTALTRDHPI